MFQYRLYIVLFGSLRKQIGNKTYEILNTLVLILCKHCKISYQWRRLNLNSVAKNTSKRASLEMCLLFLHSFVFIGPAIKYRFNLQKRLSVMCSYYRICTAPCSLYISTSVLNSTGLLDG